MAHVQSNKDYTFVLTGRAIEIQYTGWGTRVTVELASDTEYFAGDPDLIRVKFKKRKK